MKYTKKLVVLHKGLSLIESAMVLAISATIDAIANVSGLKTVKEGNQKVFVSATGKHTQLKWMTNS